MLTILVAASMTLCQIDGQAVRPLPKRPSDPFAATEVLTSDGFIVAMSESHPHKSRPKSAIPRNVRLGSGPIGRPIESARGKASRLRSAATLEWNRTTFDLEQSGDIHEEWIATGFSSFSKAAPSKIPIGSDLRFRVDAGHVRFFFVGRYEQLSLAMHLVRMKVNGQYEPIRHDWTKDIRLAERFARTYFSRTVGERLRANGQRAFSGFSGESYRCQKSSRIFIDVQELAIRKGWKLNYDEDSVAVRLTKGRKSIVLAPGADQFQTDGKWQKLPDMVGLKNGRFLAPSTFINVLR